MKKLVHRPIFQFLFFFIFWFIYEIISQYSEINWISVLLGSLFYATFMTIAFRFLLGDRNPIYLKLHDYDAVLTVLEELGAKEMRSKGEKTFYRLPGINWFNKRIIVKKTPFYLYVECPAKYKENFITLTESSDK